MHTETNNNLFNFDYSYLSLPPKFYALVNPAMVQKPGLVLFNNRLSEELGLNKATEENLTLLLSGNKLQENTTPFSQAYAGHQFGHFTLLGDGRAIMLGEHITPFGNRYDIQLKGSGQTPYSRRGDGRATFKSMLREYLFSEAMHHLGIPTSGSLAVIKTGEAVYRETVNEGGILTRVMKSHIRVGTFELARYYGSEEDLSALVDYTINRLFPEFPKTENPALYLLEKVMHLQINLVVEWLRVGFIHGVLNTDNTSISGETFDYGPCAFLNTYDPETVFSSIDTQGRYAFGNQPNIIKWNMAKLAEALLPIIHADKEKAKTLAIEKINAFDRIYSEKWHTMMFTKIGIENPEEADFSLLHELIRSLIKHKADFTKSFSSLCREDLFAEQSIFSETLKSWKSKWSERISRQKGGIEHAQLLMKKSNPVFIPRNIHVEEALDSAEKGDLSKFHLLLKALQKPYEFDEQFKHVLSGDSDFDNTYQTFCGT